MILGIGHDLVELVRWRAALARHGDRFLRRILTPDEIDYCARHAEPAQHQAARFAAKEAAAKALGCGIARGVSWHDFSIAHDAEGAPVLHVTGVARQIADRRAITTWHVSLTHTHTLAGAFVVCEN